MLVLPVFAAFATSLMVGRVDLLIAEFLALGEHTLARKDPATLRLPGLLVGLKPGKAMPPPGTIVTESDLT
ncbi:hypothetical protein CIAM_02150 [Citrobacter amalonaticus]|nr:hypothetical protein CIAM_02150 [Citrobacter amalonaticus]